MGYDAVQADASYIHEFNYPLLAHIKQPGFEYLHVIKDASVWDAQKSITGNWSGIVLYAAAGATWRHEENDIALKDAQKNRYTSAAFILAGFALLAFSIFIYTNAAINIFGVLSLAGLALSIAALGTELGYQSKLVKEVCGTVSNGGCEKVLGSKFAKGFAGITPADASVLYFATQFILYHVGCFYHPLLNSIVAIAFTGIVVAVWSIYTQAVKVKQWCALCLCIVAVLVGQITIATYLLFNGELTGLVPNAQFLIPYTTFVITILLLTLIYLPLKKLIKANAKNEQEVQSFKKWKTDASLFLAQWEKEPSCDNTIWKNDLIIGDADAPIRITVACNPYCGPCAKAHAVLDKFVDIFPGKINIQIRMLCDSNNENSERTIAVRYILQEIIMSTSNQERKEIFNDWFLDMDLARWRKKWNRGINLDVTENIRKHSQWISQNQINHTPTIFIQGRLISKRYQLEDVEKLIPQLLEQYIGEANTDHRLKV